MSRATPDDQLKFLLNCVKHSNNGKIDFVEVAKECGIVTKGAAAKRYERLMKANGIHPNGGPSTPLPSTSPPTKSTPKAGSKSSSKKRKVEDVSPSPSIKDEEGNIATAKSEPLKVVLKTEALNGSSTTSEFLAGFPPNQPPQENEDVFNFDDYCQPSVFDHEKEHTGSFSEGPFDASAASPVSQTAGSVAAAKDEDSILIMDE